MANLREIRTRISSVKSTKQITGAMKMVSAAKLKKAQMHIEQMRPYVNKFNQIIQHVSGSIDYANNAYCEQRELDRILIILITSNRGLCGGFNMNAIKQAIYIAKDQYNEQLEDQQLDFFCIGKKGADYLKSKGYRVVGERDELLDNSDSSMIHALSNQFINQFLNGQYDCIQLVYNEFINAASQHVQANTLLPVITRSMKEEEEEQTEHHYLYEPSQSSILQSMLPKSIFLQLYQAISDSIASEHGARMTAMHQATDNATSLINDLTLQYNKVRQANITNEILEIVSGAEALKK